MVAEIIERIPRSDDDALPICQLCPEAKQGDHSCVNCVLGILALLKVVDAVQVLEGGGLPRVKASSQTAHYFLRSLAQFVKRGITLTTNWEREGLSSNVSPVQVITSGPQLLYVMEQIRTEVRGDTTPIREVAVSQAIIKARIWGKGKEVYLVQYDEKAHQYQLIGGRQRRGESDPLTVMTREIAEELHENDLQYPQDYELVPLASDLNFRVLSPTFGAFSSYHFTVYRAIFKQRQLALGQADRWVTLDELLAGQTNDGQRIHAGVAREVHKQLPGGLDGLKPSFTDTQRRPIAVILRERKWEVAGLILAIISVILGLIALA
jgi:8-oxo-dGTP pyrophosphatase MutT (NUDIX family)